MVTGALLLAAVPAAAVASCEAAFVAVTAALAASAAAALTFLVSISAMHVVEEILIFAAVAAVSTKFLDNHHFVEAKNHKYSCWSHQCYCIHYHSLMALTPS